MGNKQKIMVLGAGIYQVPLIRTARAMGLETIVVSYPGAYPGFAEADRVLYLDTTDVEGVCAAAQAERIAGIVTTGTDVAVRSLGHTCDVLGLSGITEQAARVVTDKALMKQAMLDGGVATSPFAVVSSLDEAYDAAESLGYPVMIKACDVSGSRGVSKVAQKELLADAYKAAQEATKKDYVVVEGFVEGHEIGVDAYVQEGKVRLFAPHDKFVSRFGHVTVPSGHAFPLTGDADLHERVLEQLRRCVEATGINNCAVNGDFMVCPDGSVKVIEIGGRCGATCIPELISLHLGIAYYQAMIEGALGGNPNLAPTTNVPCMAKLLFSDVTGRVVRIDEAALDDVQKASGADILLDVREGDLVHCAHNGTDRWGQVIMATDSEAKLDAVHARVRACVELANE